MMNYIRVDLGKRGHWIYAHQEELFCRHFKREMGHKYECSVCGAFTKVKYPLCPICGATMDGDIDAEKET